MEQLESRWYPDQSFHCRQMFHLVVSVKHWIVVSYRRQCEVYPTLQCTGLRCLSNAHLDTDIDRKRAVEGLQWNKWLYNITFMHYQATGFKQKMNSTKVQNPQDDKCLCLSYICWCVGVTRVWFQVLSESNEPNEPCVPFCSCQCKVCSRVSEALLLTLQT